MSIYWKSCLGLLVLLVWSQAVLQAQFLTSPEHKGAYGLQLGANQGYFKDLNFSPLNYRSPGAHFAFFVQKQNAQTYWRLALKADYVTLKSKAASYFNTFYLIPQLQFSWLQRVRLPHERLSLYVGPQLAGQIDYIDWQGQNAYSYMFTYSLNAQAIVDYTLNERQHISSSLSVPLLTLLVRPPYNGIDKEVYDNYLNHPLTWLTKGEFTSLNGFFSVDWNTTFQHSLSDRFDVNLSYALRYRSTSGPSKFVHLQNQLSLGIARKF